MDTMEGKLLINQKHETVKADVIMKDTRMVLYFFSASWSPPCEDFMEQLKQLHQVGPHLLNYINMLVLNICIGFSVCLWQHPVFSTARQHLLPGPLEGNVINKLKHES